MFLNSTVWAQIFIPFCEFLVIFHIEAKKIDFFFSIPTKIDFLLLLNHAKFIYVKYYFIPKYIRIQDANGSKGSFFYSFTLVYCRKFAKNVDFGNARVSFGGFSTKSLLQQHGFLLTRFVLSLKKPRKWRTACSSKKTSTMDFY